MGKQWKQWQTNFGGSKITTGGDCSQEIKRCLLLGRKVMPNLDSIFPGGSEVKASNCNVGDPGSIPRSGRCPGEGNGNPLQYLWTVEAGRLQSTGSQRVGHDWMTSLTLSEIILKGREITLPTQVHLAKAMIFPVVLYRYVSWTMKKAECRRIDAFELWCWRKLLRVPWTARRSNQSILKEIGPKYSLEELMLKLNSNTLATWCEELTRWKRPWCGERLKAGGEGDDRGWDGQMASPTQWTWIRVNSRSWL